MTKKLTSSELNKLLTRRKTLERVGRELAEKYNVDFDKMVIDIRTGEIKEE